LFSDLNLFFDAGLAWNAGNQIKLGQLSPDLIGYTPRLSADGTAVVDPVSGQPVVDPVYDPNQRVPVLSAGLSLRVNVFGYFILEPYLAWPINRTDISKPVFGLGFTPGW